MIIGNFPSGAPHPFLSFALLDLMEVGVRFWEERELQINDLKMKAILFAMNNFLSKILMSENTTVVAYLKKQGGTVSRVMCSLAQEMWPGLN